MIEKCLNCASENLEIGSLMSRSPITYVSQHDSHSIFRKDQDIICVKCLNCGLLIPFMKEDVS